MEVKSFRVWVLNGSLNCQADAIAGRPINQK